MTELRANGDPVNTAIVIATACGIVKDADSDLLSKNGGHINLTKEWAKYLLQRMNYVKRCGCSTAKAQCLFDIQSLVEKEEIPSSLIINWDHNKSIS